LAAFCRSISQTLRKIKSHFIVNQSQLKKELFVIFFYVEKKISQNAIALSLQKKV